jgi:hypothetical protein
MSTFAALAVEAAAGFVVAGSVTLWLRAHLARTARASAGQASD